MNKLHKTEKLYYRDPFLKKCEATILDIQDKGIVLNKTVAFPEGGGQEGDRGTITILSTGEKILFLDTQKGLGRSIYIDNFPIIQVDTPIYHLIEENNLKKFKIGMQIVLEIDVARRMNLAASHTATHLMLMGVESIYKNFESKVYGCHIKEDSGRLDFRTKEKFDIETVQKIESYANELIHNNYEVKTFVHKNEPEAWYWECDNVIYPCGGMHLLQTKNIGEIKLRRKNLGKNGQRLSFSFNLVKEFKEMYHDNYQVSINSD
jgi:alanyl-tRNA synthetase